MTRRGELEACLSCQLPSRLEYSSRLPFGAIWSDRIMPRKSCDTLLEASGADLLRIALTCFNLPRFVTTAFQQAATGPR